MKENLRDFSISIIIFVVLFIYLFIEKEFIKNSGMGGLAAGAGLFYTLVLFSLFLGFIHTFFNRNLKRKFLFLLVDTIMILLLLLYLLFLSLIDGTFERFYGEIFIYLFIYLFILGILFYLSNFLQQIYFKFK